MPSNYTPNYNLNQWDAVDRVQRADFNADNAKIDAAIAAKCEIMTGTYVGDGAECQEINLGRRPKAVFVCTYEGASSNDRFSFGGLAVDGFPTTKYNYPVLEITENGFAVYFKTVNGGTYICANEKMRYHYIAFF